MVNAEILATGYYVPDEIIDNKFFAETNPYALGKGEDKEGNFGLIYRICDGHDVCKNGSWKSTFKQKTIGLDLFGEPIFKDATTVLSYQKIEDNTGGIKERRKIADGETLVDLVERAFIKSEFSAKDLDGGIVIATISDDMHYPSVANRVQERLGIYKTDFYTKDIHAACAGFTHALHSVDKMIKSNGKHYLVVGVETLTRQTDYSEVNCDLFGDGCGLVVLGSTENPDKGILATCAGSVVGAAKEGRKIKAVDYIFRDNKGYLRMPYGPFVFEVGTPAMIKTARELMRDAGLKIGDVKKIFPQQANGNMLNLMDKKLEGKCYRILGWTGNMSSANVIVSLAHAIEKKVVEKDDVVLCVGVGSGLVYSGALIRL